MKKLLCVFLTVALLVSAFAATTVNVSAEETYTEGYYKFTLELDDEGYTYAIIVDCDTSIVGDVTVPTHLGGPFRVKHILSGAFDGCDLIESITIGDYIESIGAAAFMGCENITRITLPNTPLTISSNVFTDTAYYKNSKNWENDVLYIGTNLIEAKTSITGTYQVKSGTTSIACSAFEDCSNLTGIVVPNSVLEIGMYAFYGCDSLQSMTLPFVGSSLNPPSDPIFDYENFSYIFGGNDSFDNDDYVPESLKKVVITKDTNIAKSAFENCINIESVTIPSTVKSIGEWAFFDCYKLKDLTIKNGVESIGKEAFRNCTSLTNVTIPNSVKNMSEWVFSGCDSIQKITLPFAGSDLNGTESTGLGYIFYHGVPDSIKEVVITKATVIGANAFSDLDCIESITIPRTVKKIEDYAFYNCTGLKKVNISDLAAWCNIEFAGFYGCNPLVYAKNLYINGKLATNITIPASVKTVSAKAFHGCTSLQNVIVQNGTTSLGYSAFNGCTNLKTITLPTSLDEILYSVFEGCNNLRSVFYRGTETQKNNKNFNMRNNASGAPFANAKWYYKSCVGKANHTYYNACDTSCNVCGVTRTITHKYNSGKVTKAATCKATGIKTFTCTVCKGTKTATIKKLEHSYTSKKTAATLKADGKTWSECKLCGGKKNVKTINKIKTVKLSTTKYTYNKKARTPSVIVKDSKGKTLKKNVDYTVTYAKGRKNVGKYKVVVKFKGNYSGSKNLYFTINPVKTTVKKLTAAKKSLKVAIAKKSTQVTGYQIQYSTSKKFASAKTKTVKNYKTTSVTLKRLKAKKTYYVRVRTFKKTGKTTYYSGWSTAKSVKTK